VAADLESHPNAELGMRSSCALGWLVGTPGVSRRQADKDGEARWSHAKWPRKPQEGPH
jgi:hypothetical protein